jgi:flagellar basal body-associated protein FliL
MKEDDKQFEGNELDDSPTDNSTENTDSDSREEVSDIAIDKPSGRKKILLIAAAAGLCTIAIVSYLYWGKVIPENTKASPIVMRIPAEQDRLVALNSFVIPSSGKNFNYLTFNVSFKIKESKLKKEMEMNRDLLRGKLYDLLQTSINQQAHIPSLEIIKDIVEKGVNDSLTEGNIDGLYITKFIII